MFYHFTTKNMLTVDAHTLVVDAGRSVVRAAGHTRAV